MKIAKLLLILVTVIPLCRLLLASTTAGEIVGWGVNISGQATGVPSFPFSNGIVVVTDNPNATGIVTIAGSALTHATAISAGGGFSLALRNDGTVVGWGDNQMGRAIGIETPHPYRTNGPVIVAGHVLSNVVSIAAGGNSSLALKDDGTVVAWGENKVPAGLSNVVAIAARGVYNLALKGDGSVVEWGSTPWAAVKMPASLSNVTAVAVGGGANIIRNAALMKDGTVATWGTETIYGDATPPADLTNAVAIAVGLNHSLALKKDGTVVGWGFNENGQATGIPTEQNPKVSNGSVRIGGQFLSNVVAIAANDRYSMALKSDGTVVVWGDKRFYKTVPAGLTNVVAITAGDGFCLAITTNSNAAFIRK